MASILHPCWRFASQGKRTMGLWQKDYVCPEISVGSTREISGVVVKRKEFVPHDGYGSGERHNDSRSGRRQIGLKPGYLRHTRRRYQPFVPVNPAPGALATRAAAGGVSPEGNSGPYAPRSGSAPRYKQRRGPQTPTASQARYANQLIAPARRFISSRDRVLALGGGQGDPGTPNPPRGGVPPGTEV